LQVGKLIFLLVIFSLILFLFTSKTISRASSKAPLTFLNQSKRSNKKRKFSAKSMFFFVSILLWNQANKHTYAVFQGTSLGTFFQGTLKIVINRPKMWQCPLQNKKKKKINHF
jgi:hypothetical protein